MSSVSKVIISRDSNIDLKNEEVYAVVQPPNTRSVFYLTATSYDLSAIKFSFQPNKRDILDKLAIQIPWSFQITNGGVAPNLTDGTFGLRQNFMKKIGYFDVSLNGVLMPTQSNNRFLNAFDYYDKEVDIEEKDGFDNNYMLDRSINYSDLNGSVRNPLRSLVDWETGNNHVPRGVFNSGMNVTQVGNTATITFTTFIKLKEQWFKNPLTFIQGIEITYRFLSLGFNQIFSGSYCSNITALTASFSSTPFLEYVKYSLPQDVAVPNQLQWSYKSYNTNMGNINNLATGQSYTWVIQTNTFPQVPAGLMFFITRADTDYYSTNNFGTITDTYNMITNLKLTYGNKNDVLASLTARDLFVLARENGLQATWEEFSTRGICPVYITYKQLFSADNPFIGGLSKEGLQVGAQVTGTIQGPTGNYNAYMLPLYDGSFSISEGMVKYNTAPITQQLIVEATPIDGVDLPHGSLIGDGIFDQFNDWLKETKILSTIGKKFEEPLSTLPYVGSFIKPATALAEQFGYGLGGSNRRRWDD